MKLNINFLNKTPKLAKDNEVIFLKEKNIKQKTLKPMIKNLFSNKLFNQKNFLIRNQNEKTYIFVNCTKSKTTLDYEKLGSELYVFLNNNKIENSFIDTNKYILTDVQIEKFIHGAQLKSYDFNLYKSDKKDTTILSLSVIGNKFKKKNQLRNKLNALLEGVF